MQSFTTTFAALPESRSEAPGSIYVPFVGPRQPSHRAHRGRLLSHRIDAILSVLAMAGLLSPLVLGSVMFVATSI